MLTFTQTTSHFSDLRAAVTDVQSLKNILSLLFREASEFLNRYFC